MWEAYIPENMGVLVEDEEGVGGDDVRVGVEEEVFDPTHIAVASNSLASVAEGVRRACPVFVGLGL